MKWTISFAAAAALFGGAANASPVKTERAVAPGFLTYRLRVSYEGAGGLDGTYLTISDSSVGIYPTTSSSNIPLEFYTIPGVSDGTYEMHTYPIGIVDHALGLVGTNGLFKFTDIVNPAATSYITGTTALWTEWGLDQFPPMVIQADTGENSVACVPAEGSSDETVVRPVPRDQLVYYAGKGAGNKAARWQAFPANGNGDWNVFWNNGSAITTANYMPIDVVWEFTGITCA